MRKDNSAIPASRAWTVTFSGMGVNLGLGVLYAWSVFAAALVDQLGWSKTEAALPYTVACVVFALIMVPAGKLVDKYGPRWIASLGGVFCGAGLIIAGVTESLVMAVVGFGIITGIGLGLGYSAPTPAAVRWFPPEKRGQIAGFVVAGFGLAALYISPMTKAFIGIWDVKYAFFVEGLIFIVVILVLSQFLSFPPKGYTPPAAVKKAVQSKRAPVSSGYDYSPMEMMSTPQFWMLWIMFALTASAGLMIIGHLAKIASIQAGVSWGYIMVAALAIFNAGGRFIAGLLSDRLGFATTMLLVFLLQAGNMLLFSSYVSGYTLLIGGCIAGFCYGSLLSLFPSATYSFFGMKNAGVNYGLVFTAWGAGSLIGPLVAGWMADTYNVYNNAYFISAGLLVLAALITLLTKAPKTAPASALSGAASALQSRK
ncbi:MAG TPA: oxalate:formate antiporter [Desulfotomaculum sp.]|nr:MAG: oxalate:formate antiporter [Desulfotomaculum sp. BICA1-6]HBX23371.1 oxalate:formate antiporter [Desulfotomaculum sp.]